MGTIDDDMEIAENPNTDNAMSEYKDRLEAVDLFFSKRNIDQKSRLGAVNIEGMIGCETVNEYLESTFGIRDPIRDKVCHEELSKSISIDGKGRQEVIDLFKALDIQPKDSTEMIIKKLAGVQ